MTVWRLVEIAVGLFLLVTATAVIVRPGYRSNRVLLGVAAASWAGSVVGVALGVQG